MTTFEFDDLHLNVEGVYFGSISGQAEIYPDGSVAEVAVQGLDGFDLEAKRKWRVFSRLRALETPTTFRDIIAAHLIAEVERQFAGPIRDQLDDVRAELRSRNLDLGPTQAQRL